MMKAISYIGCRVPMRDGVTLSVDVYLPADRLGEALPCRLSYSPYGATTVRAGGDIEFACKNGFVCVQADCRGKFNSEGRFHPWQKEFVHDAYDLLEWISTQPWSNGKVVAIGGSYPGATQLACLRSGHPALVACSPSAVTLDPYSIYYANGAQVLQFVSSWHIGICSPVEGVEVPGKKYSFGESIEIFPMGETSDRMGAFSPSWKELVHHEGRDEFWAEKCDLVDLAKSQAGVFYQGSWYDALGVQTFETFKAFCEVVDKEAENSPRKYTCLRVGAWGHGVNTPEGELRYGADENVTEDAETDFLLSIANGKEPGVAANPTKIQIFTMGRNQWRFIESWPLPNTEYKPLYLGEKKQLTWDAPLGKEGLVGEGEDRFDYDPKNPVPTCGGRVVGGGGQKKQTEIEKRPDVLVYTGEELTEEIEVTGEVRAELYVATSAVDTDFTVKLVDVFPDGTPYNVCDGIIRCRWRDGLEKEPRLMVPGEHEKVAFFVDVTSYAFQPGHRIRVEISSSNFPRFACNPNTGKLAADEENPVVAHQRVFRSVEEASCVILPVVRSAGGVRQN